MFEWIKNKLDESLDKRLDKKMDKMRQNCKPSLYCPEEKEIVPKTYCDSINCSQCDI